VSGGNVLLRLTGLFLIYKQYKLSRSLVVYRVDKYGC
jgi:hypothetical protein